MSDGASNHGRPEPRRERQAAAGALDQFLRQILYNVRLVETMRTQLPAAIERPVIDEHQEPALKRSFVGIELPGCAEQVEEDLLDRIFRLLRRCEGSRMRFEIRVHCDAGRGPSRRRAHRRADLKRDLRRSSGEVSHAGPENCQLPNHQFALRRPMLRRSHPVALASLTTQSHPCWRFRLSGTCRCFHLNA